MEDAVAAELQGVGERDAAGGALARILEKVEEGDQDEPDDHPERKIPEVGVHSLSLRQPRHGLPAPGLKALDTKIGSRCPYANKPIVS